MGLLVGSPARIQNLALIEFAVNGSLSVMEDATTLGRVHVAQTNQGVIAIVIALLEGHNHIASEVELLIIRQGLSGSKVVGIVDNGVDSANNFTAFAIFHGDGLNGRRRGHSDRFAINRTALTGICSIGRVIDGSATGSTRDFNILCLVVSAFLNRERRRCYRLRFVTCHLLVDVYRLLA